MIQADDFIGPARSLGFDLWAGVPCSYLTPFINRVIDDTALAYVSAANEGDAVAIASGAALAGRRAVAMMQNSGLGNAVSPLSSLNWVFRIPILLIVTLRGEPGVPDEPQHELMGRITGGLLDDLQIPWAYFPRHAREVETALARAIRVLDESTRPFAFIMRKGSVAPDETSSRWQPAARPGLYSGPFEEPARARLNRREVMERIVEGTSADRDVLIGTTGYTGRELFAVADRPNHLYMVGSMGCASSLALGLAISRPDRRVIAIDGDGSALMRMGNLATLGAYAPANLLHLVLDNGVHESTGGQATVSAATSFAAIARACGYRAAAETVEPGCLDDFLASAAPGPRLLQVRTRTGIEGTLPRPDRTPAEVARRLMVHLRVSTKWSGSSIGSDGAAGR